MRPLFAALAVICALLAAGSAAAALHISKRDAGMYAMGFVSGVTPEGWLAEAVACNDVGVYVCTVYAANGRKATCYRIVITKSALAPASVKNERCPGAKAKPKGPAS